MTESIVEEAALHWLQELGYSILHGPDIAPGEPKAERAGYGDVILVDRLRAAMTKINSKVPAEGIEDAVRQVLRAESPSMVENNRRFHRMVVDGVDVSFRQKDGSIKHDKVWLIDFDHPERNDWLAVNQFTVIENKRNRRPDIVLFINGLPMGLLELKNAADENHHLVADDLPCVEGHRQRTRRLSYLRTATTWTISSSARSRCATSCCGRNPFNAQTVRTCGSC
jgi:type I restriction enzyme R subunit